MGHFFFKFLFHHWIYKGLCTIYDDDKPRFILYRCNISRRHARELILWPPMLQTACRISNSKRNLTIFLHATLIERPRLGIHCTYWILYHEENVSSPDRNNNNVIARSTREIISKSHEIVLNTRGVNITIII